MNDSRNEQDNTMVKLMFGGAMIVAAIGIVAQMADDLAPSRPAASISRAEKVEQMDPEERKRQQEAERESKRAAHLDTLKAAVEKARSWNPREVVGDDPSTSEALKDFQWWADCLSRANTLDLGDSPEAEELRELAKKNQRAAFPILRDRFGPYARRGLWIEDMSAKTFGSGYRTVEVIGWQLAANRNIKAFHDEVKPLLKVLRFKKARYRWSDAATTATQYEIDSPDDDEIIIYRENVAYVVR